MQVRYCAHGLALVLVLLTACATTEVVVERTPTPNHAATLTALYIESARAAAGLITPTATVPATITATRSPAALPADTVTPIVTATPTQPQVQPTKVPTPTTIPAVTVTPTRLPAPGPTATPRPSLPPLPPIGPDNADRLVELMRLGKGQVMDYTWSSDGKTLAVATWFGVYLYDPATLTEIRFMPLGVHALAAEFSPDGSIIAATAADNSVRLWEAHSGTLLHTLWGHTGHAYSIAFAPDGRWLATGTTDGTLRFWDVSTGQQIRSLGVDREAKCIIDPSRRWLATGGGSTNRDQVQIWDLETTQVMHQLPITADLAGMAFNSDGNLLGVASGNSLVVWDLLRDQVHPLPYSRSPWSSRLDLAFSPDSSTLVAYGAAGTVTLWDLGREQQARTLMGYEAVFSPDGSQLAVGGAGVQLWDVATGQALHSAPATPYGWSGGLAFSPDGRLLVYDHSPTLRVLDAVRWQANVLLVYVPGNVWDEAISGSARRLATDYTGSYQDLWSPGTWRLAFSPNGVQLASAHTNAAVLWDLATGEVLHLLEGQTGRIWDLAFSPDGQILASSTAHSSDGTVRLWDPSSGQQLRVVANNTYGVRLAFSPDSRTLIGWTVEVALWDVPTGQRRASKVPIDYQNTLAVSADGSRLAIKALDGTITVQDLASGEVIRTLAGRGRSSFKQPDFLRLSADGTLLVASAEGVGDQLWSVNTGQLLRTFGGVLNLSADGGLLAIGADGETALWDVTAGREIGRLPYSRDVAFSPDRSRLALVGNDTITVWGVK